MSDKVKTNKYFIALLSGKISKKQFEKLLETSSNHQVTALCVVIYNIGEGTVSTDESLLKLVARKTTKRLIKALHRKSSSILKKRKILIAYSNIIFKILKLAGEKVIELLF